MAGRGIDTQIVVQQLVRTQFDDLNGTPPSVTDSNSPPQAHDAGKPCDAGSKELEFWLKRLEMEKKSSSGELLNLKDHASKLNHAWRAFHRRMPVEEQNGLQHHNPEWEDIARVIAKVQSCWIARNEGTYGKATAILRKILDTIHSHQTFLRILPESNNYASILCGSIQVLIQASATHQRVAEALSQGILEINDSVRACSIDIQLFGGIDQVEIAAALYCRIFKCLEQAMSWYTKSRAKRFLQSFKEDTYKDFENDIREVRRLSDSIMRRAQQGMHIENRTTNLMVQEARQDFQTTRQDIREIRQRLDDFQLTFEQKTYSNGNISGLSSAPVSCEEKLSNCAQELEQWQTPQLKLEEPPITHDNQTSYKATLDRNLVNFPQNICKHWEARERLIPSEPIAKFFVEAAIGFALQEWRLDEHLHFMCVSAPWQTTSASATSQLATAICSFAVQAQIPIICFSPPASDDEDGEDLEKGSNMTDHCVYSLIMQLIKICAQEPISEEVDPTFDCELIAKDFNSALSLLGQLLDASPSSLLCVIDNFQCLEDPAMENKNLLQLVNTLQQHGASCATAAPARSLKVFFTSSGHSHILRDILEPHEMVFADTLPLVSSPSQSKPTRGHLIPITPGLLN